MGECAFSYFPLKKSFRSGHAFLEQSLFQSKMRREKRKKQREYRSRVRAAKPRVASSASVSRDSRLRRSRARLELAGFFFVFPREFSSEIETSRSVTRSRLSEPVGSRFSLVPS